jgi:histidinol-phosphatase (PHP family)
MKIDYCYHTHTNRCGHARGKDEDYVLFAISKGVKVLGFTDHVFLKGYTQPTIRGNYEDLDEYISSLTHLKNKYKDKIEILIGFEAEYIKKMVPYYKELLKDKIDYLILGQHLFISSEDKITWYFKTKDNHKMVDKYADDLIEGMKSGLYKYVAHPDLFASGISIWDEYAISVAKRIIEAAIKYDIPLEYNLGGYRYPYEQLFAGMKYLKYPNENFWDLASTYPIKVIIGPDAHDPEYVHDEKEMEHVAHLIKKYNWKLVNRL